MSEAGAEAIWPDGDTRMAEILAGAETAPSRVREQLRLEGGDAASDLIPRLNALEFIDSVVGEVTDMPEQLGDYKITSLLGRGGMGTVFEAYQETLEREVALKVLSPAYSSDVTMRQRFRSEARASASLHHQHIVPIYDYGETAGMLYFAMEKVDGVSLDKHITMARRQGRPAMQPSEAAGRFAGVADALAHAHKRRLLHRDVKPGNLLVNPDGSLALADFGLSKALGEVSMSLTAGNSFMGTLRYAPPEQAKGEPVTPASDLYSLGVTIFETVTGELPLSGETTESMLDALLNGKPRRLREVLPRAPKDLEAVLEKLLAKDPADRYADGEELARDLQRVADGEPVRVRRRPLLVRAWRRARKNPGLSTAVSIVFVLALVLLLLLRSNLAVRQSSITSRHANLLQQAMAEAMREPGPAEGPEAMLETLTGFAPMVGEPGRAVLSALQQAELLRPRDPSAATLRAAYLEGVDSAATELLRSGQGHAARKLLDRALESAQAERARRDDASWLADYDRYLARAVASLTASVARADEAAVDLIKASMVRPGAFFPRLLHVFLDRRADPAADRLIAAVDRLVAEGPDGAAEVAGELMLTFAGLHRLAAAHMMTFDMPAERRRALYLAARRLLGQRTLPVASPVWTGLERDLAAHARAAMRVSSDRSRLLRILDEGEKLLSAMHPESPLQSWGQVYNLLRDPAADPSRLASGRQLPLELQARAWRDLLRLRPERAFVQAVRRRAERLLADHAQDRFAPELRARLFERVGTADQAHAAAKAWYAAEPSSVEALFYRFGAELRVGDVTAARFTPALILQRTTDVAAARSRILAKIDEALAKPSTERTRQWRQLRMSLSGAGR